MTWCDYEKRTAQLLPWRSFLSRLLGHVVLAAILLGASLTVATVGFHFLAGQEWIDAVLNSAMLLGGMGPIGEIRGDHGKLFAAAFAIYAGLIFIAVIGIVVAPVLHRAAHRFHVEEPPKAGSKPAPPRPGMSTADPK